MNKCSVTPPRTSFLPFPLPRFCGLLLLWPRIGLSTITIPFDGALVCSLCLWWAWSPLRWRALLLGLLNIRVPQIRTGVTRSCALSLFRFLGSPSSIAATSQTTNQRRKAAFAQSTFTHIDLHQLDNLTRGQTQRTTHDRLLASPIVWNSVAGRVGHNSGDSFESPGEAQNL